MQMWHLIQFLQHHFEIAAKNLEPLALGRVFGVFKQIRDLIFQFIKFGANAFNPGHLILQTGKGLVNDFLQFFGPARESLE